MHGETHITIEWNGKSLPSKLKGDVCYIIFNGFCKPKVSTQSQPLFLKLFLGYEPFLQRHIRQ